MKRILTGTLAAALALTSVLSAARQAATATSSATQPAQSPPGIPSESVGYSFHVSSESPAVLVVPAPEMSADALADLTEDLEIMSRLIDRLLEGASVKTPTWGTRLGRGEGAAKTVYLPRFGALFAVQVDFPLTAPAQQPAETQEAATDQLWAEVKDSLRAPGRARRDMEPADLAYDELKVESLKRTLTQALKHASNIRHLGPDERIIIIAVEQVNNRTNITQLLGGEYGQPYELRVPAVNVRPTHVVSLHATKKDTDAVAKGQIDATVFKERVKIVAYALPALAHAATDSTNLTVTR